MISKNSDYAPTRNSMAPLLPRTEAEITFGKWQDVEEKEIPPELAEGKWIAEYMRKLDDDNDGDG